MTVDSGPESLGYKLFPLHWNKRGASASGPKSPNEQHVSCGRMHAEAPQGVGRIPVCAQRSGPLVHIMVHTNEATE